MGLKVGREKVTQRGCRMSRGRKRRASPLPWASLGHQHHTCTVTRGDAHRHTHAHTEQSPSAIQADFSGPDFKPHFQRLWFYTMGQKPAANNGQPRQLLGFSLWAFQIRTCYRTQWGSTCTMGGREQGRSRDKRTEREPSPKHSRN